MWKSITRYIERCGIEFDVAVNVLLGGQLGQTISMRCALADRAGKPWGRFMCWFLSWAVQEDHCALQFSNKRVPVLSYLRASIAFLVGITGCITVVHTVVEGFMQLKILLGVG